MVGITLVVPVGMSWTYVLHEVEHRVQVAYVSPTEAVGALNVLVRQLPSLVVVATVRSYSSSAVRHEPFFR